MKFDIKEVYNFSYSRKITPRTGKPFILLKYNGSEALPGYENTRMCYRVKLLPYQEEWTEEDWAGRIIPCEVQRYLTNDNGDDTDMPELVQSKQHVLQERYSPGEEYNFKVVLVPGDKDANGDRKTSYVLTDDCGYFHYLKAVGVAYKPGDEVSLVIKEIDKKHLRFEFPLAMDFAPHFEVGFSYDFTIIDICKNKKGTPYCCVRDGVVGGIHHFYYTEEREEGLAIGDTINLRVAGFSDKMGMFLEDPVCALPPEDWARIEQLDSGGVAPNEGQQLEYKSSFAFHAKAAVADISRQLHRELMYQIAAFMNADGGELRIGYKDDGSPGGIDKDIPYLNDDNKEDDKYNGTYPYSVEGLRRKFINAIRRNLGDFAAGNVSIQFAKKKNDFGRVVLVCHIYANQLSDPIWWRGTELYVRCENTVQRYFGDDITKFILQRKENVARRPIAAKTVPSTTVDSEAELLDDSADLKDFVPPSSLSEKTIWRHITLYKNGQASRQSKSVISDTVLCNIPVAEVYNGADGRLVFCYANGRINVMNPARLMRKKLKKSGSLYAYGYNLENGVKLLHAFVCHKDDYLVVKSRKADGREMIKAVRLSDMDFNDSMHTLGKVVVKQELATTVSMQVVPAAHMEFIEGIISNSKDKSGPGYSVESDLCKDILSYLESQGAPIKTIEY